MRPAPDVPLLALAGLERAGTWLLLRLLLVLVVFLVLRVARWPLAFAVRLLGVALLRLDAYALALTAVEGVGGHERR